MPNEEELSLESQKRRRIWAAEKKMDELEVFLTMEWDCIPGECPRCDLVRAKMEEALELVRFAINTAETTT